LDRKAPSISNTKISIVLLDLYSKDLMKIIIEDKMKINAIESLRAESQATAISCDGKTENKRAEIVAVSVDNFNDFSSL
jgi:hypothetical protein